MGQRTVLVTAHIGRENALRSARFVAERLTAAGIAVRTLAGEFSSPGAAFLQVPDSHNDHDLGLFGIGPEAGDNPAGRATVGLYHLAWEVETLGELHRIACAAHQWRGEHKEAEERGLKALRHLPAGSAAAGDVLWRVVWSSTPIRSGSTSCMRMTASPCSSSRWPTTTTAT